MLSTYKPKSTHNRQSLSKSVYYRLYFIILVSYLSEISYFVPASYCYYNVLIMHTLGYKKCLFRKVYRVLTHFFIVIFRPNQRHITVLRKFLINCRFIQVSYAYIIQFIINNNISIGLLNPGSLGTRHDEFLLAMEQHSVDVMAINETWLRAGEEARAPSPPGYRLRHAPRPAGVRARGGGVGFYLRRGVYVRFLEHPPSSIEQMWISIKLNGLQVVIGTAYRPQWVNVDTFLDALTESLSSFSAFDHIVLLGDFNIDMLKIEDASTKKLKDFSLCMDLCQYVTEPTHFTDHSETLIDLIFSRTKVSDVCINYVPELSNHAFLTCEINVKKPKPHPRCIVYRPLKDIDMDTFNADLNAIQWESLLSEDVNETLCALNSQIVNLFDLHAPVKTIYVKDLNYPWLTPTVKAMINLRNEAHVKSRKTKLDIDKKYYKELKQIVKVAMHSEKTAYFQHYVNNNLNDPQKLWKHIKRNVADFKKRQIDLPEHLCDPDCINDHFLNIPDEGTIDVSLLTHYWFNRFNKSTFSLKTVNQDTIVKIMKNFKTNAQGFDCITLDMLLLTMPRTLGIITSLINRSIQSGIFPEAWKVAKVRPLPKINNPVDLKDLRPISILPFMSKIIEKVVSMQLTEYLQVNDILPSKQSGFRKGRGTVTALLDVVDDILAGQDVGEGAILVLLDFSRAFDTISPTLLLSKLAYYGFDSVSMKWFSSYLSNRTQSVEVCGGKGINKYSSPAVVNKGVPQGSILGPILYILYSADLANIVNDSKYHIYADDLQVYRSFNPSETTEEIAKLNKELDQISEWSRKNCLALNPLKTKFLAIGTKTQIRKINSHNIELKLGGVKIEQVTEARNLGVLMDDGLKFEKHVLETVRNCFYRLRVLYKIRNYLDVDTRIHLCESLILSKLNYADTVIGGCLLVRTKKIIQRIQNSCARFCFTIPRRAHITPYLNSNNLLNMESRRALHFASLLFGVIQKQQPSYLYNKLKFCNRQSRIPLRMVCPSHHSSAFRGSFRYCATKCWNNIPPPIRQSPSIGSFKLKYKKYLLTKQKGLQ